MEREQQAEVTAGLFVWVKQRKSIITATPLQ